MTCRVVALLHGRLDLCQVVEDGEEFVRVIRIGDEDLRRWSALWMDGLSLHGIRADFAGFDAIYFQWNQVAC